jgi:HEAT repeat protein
VLGAARTAVTVANREDEPPYTRVSRQLEPLLEDVDLRTRQTAVSLLGRIGDEGTERALTAFANGCDIPDLAESARDAAKRIRQRDSEDAGEASADPGPDDQRVEELLDALEKRVEDLERWR